MGNYFIDHCSDPACKAANLRPIRYPKTNNFTLLPAAWLIFSITVSGALPDHLLSADNRRPKQPVKTSHKHSLVVVEPRPILKCKYSLLDSLGVLLIVTMGRKLFRSGRMAKKYLRVPIAPPQVSGLLGLLCPRTAPRLKYPAQPVYIIREFLCAKADYSRFAETRPPA